MQILFFDPFNGVAGDMVTAALLALGADREAVARAMRSVVGEPEISVVDRCGIRALRIETGAGEEHRTLEEVLARVAACDAPQTAIGMAGRVFERIHRAETSVHGAHAHFHEVGADDAVADVIGACTAFHALAPGAVVVRPVGLGEGIAKGSHGSFPLPAPATIAILHEAGLSVRFTGEQRELCTPTGAALLAEFVAVGGAPLDDARVLEVGYGAGSRDPDHIPNVLRAALLETGDPGRESDRVDILETNVDDVTGEMIGHAIGRLMEEGARDASAVPAVMKKGRAGHLVRVVCAPADTDRLAALLARELGTLGIRCIPSVHRFVARRTVEDVAVTIGDAAYPIRVKVGWDGPLPSSLKAEYEDARACAQAAGIPLREVLRLAEEAGWRMIRERGAER
ncbi:MAG: nickel pincer cofactor biosynthesis protein LarC [Methanomicrobiaceae archaeon]|nr:nickel pincer cofactor biosynthesis protein LarC [Methanomicrobiaceae archaeon]